MSEEFDPQVICNFENNGFTVADIEKIARFQSYILYCVLANIVLLFAGGFMVALLPVVSLAVLIGMIISFVSLRNAMKKGSRYDRGSGYFDVYTTGRIVDIAGSCIKGYQNFADGGLECRSDGRIFLRTGKAP